MSPALELISIVERAGGKFLLDGDRLGIVPKEAAAPVMEKLKEHKAEVIAELAQRPSIPAGVRLVRYAPKAAPVRLSNCSVVTNVEKFVETTLKQLDARLNGKPWHAGNWPLSGLIERLAAVGVDVVLDNPKQALQ